VIRLYLGLAIIAILVLALLWHAPGPAAKFARWTAAAYLLAAVILLTLGLGM
jgi:hypothetical protein